MTSHPRSPADETAWSIAAANAKMVSCDKQTKVGCRVLGKHLQTRAWAAVVAGLFAATMLAACGTAAPASPSAANLDWDRTLASAKQEGRLAIMGQVGPTVRDALTAGFQAKYPDIAVDYTAGTGAEVSTKVLTQRSAGKFETDVVINGTNTLLNLAQNQATDPLESYLLGPDLRDPSKWRDGKFEFADNAGKYVFVFLSGVKSPLNYNPSLVASGTITSYKDLLDPRWDSKLAMFDPSAGGAGIGFIAFLYAHPELGKTFIQQLFAQHIILTRDIRQLADWVGRGQYPVALGTDEFTAIDLKARGVPIELLPADSIREGSYLTGSWGGVSVLNRAPHPSAARVYLNWLLSSDGQLAATKAAGYPSRRSDVPTDQVLPILVPKAGGKYIKNYDENFVNVQREAQQFVKSVIPE